MARYRREVAAHQACIADARRERSDARIQRRWWTWLRLCVSALLTPPDAPRPPGPPSRRSGQEDILAAGIAGERHVENRLAPAFCDEWVLFRGYKNRRGEIDSVLLGPGGLFAIEAKNRNATVHVDGDSWRCDEHDRNGKRVRQGLPFTDKKGRSPSREVNEPADELERLLRSRRQPVSVRRGNPGPPAIRSWRNPKPHRQRGHLNGLDHQRRKAFPACPGGRPASRTRTADNSRPPPP